MKLFEFNLTRPHIFLLGSLAALVIAFLALRVVIGPIVLSMFLAYLLNPTLTRVENRGWNRGTLTLLIMALGLLIAAILVWILFPILYAQLFSLAQQIPQFRIYLDKNVLPFLASVLGEILGDAQLKSKAFHLSDMLPSSDVATPSFIISGVGKSTQILFNTLIGIVLTPFFTYYFIRYANQFTKFFQSFIPSDLQEFFRPLMNRFDCKLRAVIRGQFLVIIMLTILYGTSLAFSGMPFGLAVGVITGLVRIVPYLDLLVGGSLAFLVLATNSQPSSVVIAVLLSFAAIQLLDIFVITPRIVGRASGIHPFVVILGILCFGDWFGFFGVLLAIPLLAMGGVLLKTLVSVYKRSMFFRQKPEKMKLEGSNAEIGSEAL